MKAFIVDDETDSREIIKLLLNSNFPKIQIVGEAATIQDGIDFLNHNTIDLLFLDIQLNGSSGFDLLRHVVNVNFDIIYITAYNQFAIEAIKNHALDYLLKPIDDDEFIEAVQKATTSTKNLIQQQLNTLIANIPNQPHPAAMASQNQLSLNKIVLLVGNTYELISIENIIRLKSDNNYTEFHLSDKRKIIASKPLKFYEEKLPNFKFIRVHQSHLVNTDFIKQLEKGKYALLTLTDGSKIEISQSRKEELFKILGL
ncbi:MAG TPA: LytTR family DNA-binding domain-containing protein [Bacteroidia bacterium]